MRPQTVFMIQVFGTSHVSEESIELIDEKLEEHDPEAVALELDLVRLNALLNGENSSADGPLFLKAVKKLQEYVGGKTGVMPGDEMVYAYRKAMHEGKDVYLIDQDIRITVDRVKSVSRKEKVKAAASIALGFLKPGEIDVGKIPEQDIISKLLDELEDRFPQLYQVFVEERNQVMFEALQHVQEEHEGQDIVAFVGAAHEEALRKELETFNP